MMYYNQTPRQASPRANCPRQTSIAFSNKVRCLVDVSQVVDIVYLNFSKAFARVSHNLHLEILMCYSLDKRSVQLVGNWLTDCTQTVVVNGSFYSW